VKEESLFYYLFNICLIFEVDEDFTAC